jgi:hypothetical protein
MNWLLPHPLHIQSARPATQRKTEKERYLPDERGGDGGGGAISEDSEKAWTSINHPLLSTCIHVKIIFPNEYELQSFF